MSRILVIDNDPSILSVLSAILSAEGYEAVSVRDGEEALMHIKSEEYDLIITDVRMTPIDGMAILKAAHDEQPSTSVIMLTAFGSVETAIGAMKLGAFDYVTKPFKVDELLITVERGLEYKRTLNENVDLRAQLTTQYRFENMIAESPAMKRLCSVIEKVAPTDTSILIYGESGTGKELVAKAIHTYSNRNDKKFLAVNCAALPEALLESEMFGHVKGAFTGATSNKKGLIEEVGDGTIFLDEIGGMPISIQAKFLRVLQERELRKVGGNEIISVNARVLAATNVSLEDLITQGLFREDLYYRLNIIQIEVEPLRRRKEDIIPLVHHVIRSESKGSLNICEVDDGACDVFEKYAWPGNVRELENAVKHALAFSGGGAITKAVLPSKILGTVARMELDDGTGYSFMSLKNFVQEKEQEYIEKVLEAVGGDKEKAAKALNVSLATFYRKLPRLAEEA